MRYLYKQTGVVVESSIKLDSSIFTLVSANQKVGEETEAPGGVGEETEAPGGVGEETEARAESVKKTARKAGTQPAKK